MLLELNIRDFAIIEETSLKFEPGFNTITGETGAGKSILLEALQLVLGARAQRSFIRHGRDRAFIEAVFSVDRPEVKEILNEAGIDVDDVLIINREISVDRPSIARINQVVVTSQLLQTLSPYLLDLVLQDENRILMKPREQMALLDNFVGPKQHQRLQLLNGKLDEIAEIEREIAENDIDPQTRAREIDLLEFQLNEIESLDFKENEDIELEEELKKLEGYYDVMKNLHESRELLSMESGIISQVEHLISLFSKLTSIDSNYETTLETLEGLRYELSDLSSDIERETGRLTLDEGRLSYVEERLNAINHAKRKYGYTYEEFNSFYKSTSERLNFLLSFEDHLKKQEQKLESLEQDAIDVSMEIRKERIETSKVLEKAMKNELHQLDIQEGQFKIDIEEAELSRHGMDHITFLIATNKGEKMLPIQEIASGGEMSRIMLGFKSIMSRFEQISTIVFDEIDAGMSGVTAMTVADKMIQLSKHHQLIVISHLPQVVAASQTHFQIQKEFVGNKTLSTVKKLSVPERIQALATMISGREVTERSLETARELLISYDQQGGEHE